MRITLLGTGYAIPTKDRVNSGILVENILFDCGSGVLHRIAESGRDTLGISAVFFTHHHLDHNADFLSLLKANWMKGRREMKVFGPEGTKKWLSKLMEAYPYLREKLELEIEELQDGAEISISRISVEAANAKHGNVAALAYKISSGRKSVVYSGDTEPCEGVVRLCKGATLLIHECSYLEEAKKTHGHSTLETLGKMLRSLEVKKVVLTHLPEEIISKEKAIKKFGSKVIIGKDLMEV